MKDRLQTIADVFCNKFGLNRVRLEFAEEFTPEDIKLYNYIFNFSFEWVVKRSGWWAARKLRKQLAFIPEIEKEEIAKAKKGFLWKEFINNKKQQSLAGIILKEEANILGAAIRMCEAKFKGIEEIGREFGLNKEQLELAEGIANKMEQFHDVKGVVLQEFKDILEAVKRNPGKMPLIKGGPAVFEQYVHETIHYVLFKNKIFGKKIEPFNEGLCTYLHFRFRWSRAWYFRMYIFGRGEYRQWAKYFKSKFQNVPDKEIGPLLKKNLKLYLSEIVRRYPI